MIVVVEGPSAVGKTTLLQHVPPAQIVGEDWNALGFPRNTWPDLHTPAGQQFSLTRMSHRWELLRAAGARYGCSYADTDPLKLYYDFALAATGRLPHAVLDEAFRIHRQAMSEQRIGFADHVVFLWTAPEIVAQRKRGDSGATLRCTRA